jgi:transposase
VRQKTATLLSIQNWVTRNRGVSLRGHRIKQLTLADLERLVPEADRALAVRSNLAVMHCLTTERVLLERTVKERSTLRPALPQLLTVSGIGDILALTIRLETGDIRRFATVGTFASSCRCVDSQKLSNGKRTGQGHTKNGHPYWAWAFVEAANVAVRDNAQITRYEQRKKEQTHGVVALKAVAHKLARACDDVIRDQVAFETTKAFG